MDLGLIIQGVLHESVLKPVVTLSVFGVNVLSFLAFIVTFVLLLVFFTIIKKIVLIRIKRITERTTSRLDDTMVQIIKDIKYVFYIALSLFIASRLVNVGVSFSKVIYVLFVIILVFEFILLAQNIGSYLIRLYWSRIDLSGEDDPDNLTAVNAITMIMKISLWIIGLLIVLANLGVEISALVASLGISSIAVAFALQNILADIFSSFSIYLDRPFKVGDFIVIGDDNGIVKKVGVKSTRIQTLQGQELIISNHELTNTRIHNYKQMKSRRILFTLGVVYGTPLKEIRKLPALIKEIIDAQDMAEFDRAHFKGFGDYSLEIEVVYFVNSSEYLDYMDTHQSINLGIYESFEKIGVEFAFPTQTIILEK